MAEKNFFNQKSYSNGKFLLQKVGVVQGSGVWETVWESWKAYFRL